MIAAAYNQHDDYLQTLSFVSAMLKKQALRDSLLNAQKAEEVYTILTAHSGKGFQEGSS
jgi:mannitol/fructose-specific phosphotransferase system IIA component (Ntr-type)